MIYVLHRVEVNVLLATFKDRSKLALIAFLGPIIDQLEKINAMFQVQFILNYIFCVVVPAVFDRVAANSNA